MASFTLAVVDVTGIQGYIFGSNKIRENAGASQLVHEATHGWMQDALPKPHNLSGDGAFLRGPKWQIERDDEIQAEVVLRGGGNVLIVFRSPDDAKATFGRLSRRLLQDAPGLEIAVAFQPFDWDNDRLGTSVYNQLFAELARFKQQRKSSAPQLGLSVTLECRATGLPAVGFEQHEYSDEPERALSADVLAKLRQEDPAYKRLKQMFPQVERAGYVFRRDFDNLGGSEGEQDYIAVVHADGNGMGQRFKELIAQPANQDNRACLHALRELSEAIEQAGRQALSATVDQLLAALDLQEPFERDAAQDLTRFREGLKKRGNRRILPFRPLVYGGDDVTFVCDGRLGLTLTAAYLTAWERAAEDLPGGPASACASAVIVKTHYPFARAYKLGEKMCTKLKDGLRAKGAANFSAMDWHFSLSSISGSIKEIRTREYRSDSDDSLVMRPVTLAPQPGTIFDEPWQHWQAFERVLWELNYGPAWRERRNKVKALRTPLRQGAQATERFRLAYRLPPLPTLDSGEPALQRQGWAKNRCGYFDAIEAIDFYLPLQVPVKERR